MPKDYPESASHEKSVSSASVLDSRSKHDKITAIMFLQREGHLSAPSEAVFAIRTLFLIHSVMIALENPLGFFPSPSDEPWFTVQIAIRCAILSILAISLIYLSYFLRWPQEKQDLPRSQRQVVTILTVVWALHQGLLFFMFVLRPNPSYYVRFSCFLHALTTMIMCSLGGIPLRASLTIWIVNILLWFSYNSLFRLMDYSNLTTIEYFPILFAAGLVGFLHQVLKSKAVKWSRANRQLAIAERQRAENLVDAILPPQVATTFRHGKKSFAAIVEDATVLFIGIVDENNPQSDACEDCGEENKSDRNTEFLKTINELYGAFDELANELGVLAVERLRDTYVVVAGANGIDRWQCHQNPASIIAIMAARVLEIVKIFNDTTSSDWKVRMGINSGSVIAVVVGRRDYHFTLLGDTVNTSARMMQTGRPGRIQITESTFTRLKGQRFHQSPNPSLTNMSHIAPPLTLVELRRSSSIEMEELPSPPMLHRHTNTSSLFHAPVDAHPPLVPHDGPVEVNVPLGNHATRCRFLVHRRGVTEVKGKGRLKTHWLEMVESVSDVRKKLLSVANDSKDNVTDMDMVSKLIAESVKLNKLSLAFDEHPEQEQEFQDDYGARNRKMLRNLITIAWFPVAIAGVLTLLQGQKYPEDSYWYMIVGVGYIVIWGIWVITLMKKLSRRASQITCFSFMVVDVTLTTLETWLYMTHGRTNIMQNITDASMIIWAVFVFMRLSFPFNLLMPALFVVSDFAVFSMFSPYGSIGAMMRALIAGGMSLCGIEVERYLEAAARYDFLLRAEVQRQRSRANKLVQTLLPPYAGERMVGDKHDDEEHVDDMMCTVLQTDIVGFTNMSSKLDPASVSTVVNRLFSVFDDLVSKHNLCRMYTVGDAYIVVGGVPGTTKNHSRATCSLAMDMINSLDDMNVQNANIGLPDDVSVRVGIGTGKVFGGIVKGKRPTYVLWGDGVIQAEIMEKGAQNGHICVAHSTIKHFEETEKSILDSSPAPIKKGASVVSRYIRDMIRGTKEKRKPAKSPKQKPVTSPSNVGGSPFRFVRHSSSSSFLPSPATSALHPAMSPVSPVPSVSYADTLLDDAFDIVPADVFNSRSPSSSPIPSPLPSPAPSPSEEIIYPWQRDQSDLIKPIELPAYPRARRRFTLESGLANFILSRS